MVAKQMRHTQNIALSKHAGLLRGISGVAPTPSGQRRHRAPHAAVEAQKLRRSIIHGGHVGKMSGNAPFRSAVVPAARDFFDALSHSPLRGIANLAMRSLMSLIRRLCFALEL